MGSNCLHYFLCNLNSESGFAHEKMVTNPTGYQNRAKREFSNKQVTPQRFQIDKFTEYFLTELFDFKCQSDLLTF